MVIQKKIMFAGLDNGGKTSIILSFQKKFSFMDCKPTLGLKRTDLKSTEMLGFKFVAWDMGGQGQFRQSYFNRKYQVFVNTLVLFYIIDIGDIKRFEESLIYLSRICETFSMLEESPRIVICLHKVDPDISQKYETRKNIDLIKSQIENLNLSFSIHYHETSIHNVASIYKAFSTGIMKSTPLAGMIEDRLKSYAKLTSSLAVILLTDDMLTIAQHSRQNQLLEICEVLGTKFLSTMAEMENFNLFPRDILVNLQKNENLPEDSKITKNAMVFMQSFTTTHGEIINLVSLTKNRKKWQLSINYLPRLANQISHLLSVTA